MVFESLCPNCGQSVETYKNPFPTADTVIIRDGKILLIRRMNPPIGWALPGGFIDYNESAESAAVRETQEETGLKVTALKLLGVYSEPGRDPRFHTLTVVFLADTEGEAIAGDDAAEARWFDLSNLPSNIVFDHKKVINDANQLR